MNLNGTMARRGAEAALTLVEVVISMSISTVVVVGLVVGYLYSTTVLEKSGESLAANALASQRIEQTRAAKWDVTVFPVVDELVATNFPVQVVLLDLPTSGTNATYATNFTQITTVSSSPPLKAIRVDCVWTFAERGLQTNTIVAYRRPD